MQRPLDRLRSLPTPLPGEGICTTADTLPTLLQSMMGTAVKPLIVFDANLRVVCASRSFYQNFGMTDEIAGGAYGHGLSDWQCHTPALCAVLEALLAGSSEFLLCEVQQELSDSGHRTLLLNALKLHRPDQEDPMLLLTVEDVTEQRRVEQEQKVARERLCSALKHEKNVADTLQHAMLRTIPENTYPGWAVAAVYKAASDEALVGGDFHDLFRLDDGRIAIVIGDVMGKGLVAALHTSNVKAVLRLLLREQPSPARALSRLNLVLCDAQRMDDLPTDTITACALAIVEPTSGETVIACAGMEPPLLLRAASGKTTAGKDSEIVGFAREVVTDCHGLLLGVSPTADFRQTTVQLAPGDLLLTVTDGITEARRGRHDFFGYKGLTDAAVKWADSDTVEQIGQGILEAACEFSGGTLNDDACIVLIRRTNLNAESWH